MKQHTKPIYKRTWFIVTIVVVSIMMYGMLTADERVAREKDAAIERAAADKIEAAEIAARTPTDWLGIYIEKDAKRIDVRQLGVSETRAMVMFNAKEAFTKRLTRVSIHTDAMSIMQAVVEAPELKGVTVVWARAYFPLVDELGNSEETEVMRHQLPREVLDRINWDNMLPDMFENLVSTQGTLFIHRALK